MKKLISILVTVACIAACNKKEVDATGFSVTPNKETYKVNDTVNFSFTGNAWYLTFYSGEPGKKFENRERIVADGIPRLQFLSYQQTGSQANTLRVLVSTNFSGVYDSTNIYNATWADITNQITLSTGKDSTASGVVNLSQFVTNDHPAYIAFKYAGFKDASAQRTWTIRNIILNNVLPDNMSYSLLTSAESTAGFQQVNMKTSAVKWTISSSQLQVKGGATANSPEAETWVISKALILNKVTPDVGIPLKNMTTAMNFYKYIYTTAGAYTATFVASNINRYDNKEDIREVSIKVE
jgi:hypothetical protein